MFMIEGKWIGYRCSQDRVVHREYVPGSRRKFAEMVKALYSIAFTDGTSLELTVTEVAKKRLPTILSYGNLIRDCVYAGVNSVAALHKK